MSLFGVILVQIPENIDENNSEYGHYAVGGWDKQN